MKFVLLHGKNEDAVLIAIDRILYAEEETYGTETVTDVELIPHGSYSDITLHVRESVEEVYRLIRQAQREQV